MLRAGGRWIHRRGYPWNRGYWPAALRVKEYGKVCSPLCTAALSRFTDILIWNARSIYGHIDFLGKGATSLLEDVRKGEFFRSAPLTATLFRPNLKYEYGKNCPNYNFSSFPMFGWIIRKRCREFRKLLIIASKTILYPKSSLCAETLPVNL